MRMIGKILVVLFVIGLVGALISKNDGESPSQSSTSLSPTILTRLGALRDEGIDNIGWVAGNAYGRPIWAQVKPYVGEDGSYYRVLISLSTQGPNSAGEAMANIDRYKSAVKLGRSQRYDEADMLRRVERTNQIAKEISALLDRGR